MSHWRKWQLGLALLVTATLTGPMGQFGCITAMAKNFNPCGTILNCDPYEWDIMMMDGNFPDWDLDPTCTIPGSCGDGIYPYDADGTTSPSEASTSSGDGFGGGFGGGMGGF